MRRHSKGAEGSSTFARNTVKAEMWWEAEGETETKKEKVRKHEWSPGATGEGLPGQSLRGGRGRWHGGNTEDQCDAVRVRPAVPVVLERTEPPLLRP